MTVLDDVAAERQRQIAKGYDAAHDDGHTTGEIAKAAAVYALHPFNWHIVIESRAGRRILSLMDFWPWNWSEFRPEDRRKNLIKSAAMIVSEIERLDRIR